jgi:hypothetical protein
MLGTALVTGFAAWLSFGGGISKAEGQDLKTHDNAHDQKIAVLEANLAAQKAILDEVKTDVKVGNATTQEKLDAILLSLPRDSAPSRIR